MNFDNPVNGKQWLDPEQKKEQKKHRDLGLEVWPPTRRIHQSWLHLINGTIYLGQSWKYQKRHTVLTHL